MVVGEPLEGSTESSGAEMRASSRGDDLSQSPTGLRRDTTHHTGAVWSSWWHAKLLPTPRVQRRDLLTKPGIFTPSSIVPSHGPSGRCKRLSKPSQTLENPAKFCTRLQTAQAAAGLHTVSLKFSFKIYHLRQRDRKGQL